MAKGDTQRRRQELLEQLKIQRVVLNSIHGEVEDLTNATHFGPWLGRTIETLSNITGILVELETLHD